MHLFVYFKLLILTVEHEYIERVQLLTQPPKAPEKLEISRVGNGCEHEVQSWTFLSVYCCISVHLWKLCRRIRLDDD